jgi:SAM-dependent methyltransferase
MSEQVARQSLRQKAKSVLPASLRHWLRRQRARFSVWPPVGTIHLGSVDRTTPISSEFGFDRGHCIDRYYIENFLRANAGDIGGHVLEVADDNYTRMFGGDRVAQSTVLHAREGNQSATLVTDLTRAENVSDNTFDCIILTQTLQFIFDFSAAIATLHRILKPEGVVLATFPGISQISRYDMSRWGEYWRFTSLSAQQIFARAFGETNVQIRTYGNVYAAVGLLHGLAIEDIDEAKLDAADPDYEVVITVRAVKKEAQ